MNKSQTLNQLHQALNHCRNHLTAQALSITESQSHWCGQDAEVDALLGELYLNLQQPDKAVNCFTSAAAQSPQNPGYLSRLGQAYLAAQDNVTAVDILNQAIALGEPTADTLNALGAAYINLRHFTAAEKFLEKALALDPHAAIIHDNLVLAWAGVGKTQEALALAITAKKRWPSANRYMAAARLLLEAGEIDDAIKDYEKAIQLDKLSGAAHQGLAKSRKFTPEERGRIEKIELLLSQPMPILERYCFHFALGKMYDDIGVREKAFHHYQQGNRLVKPATLSPPPRTLFRTLKKLATNARLHDANYRIHPSNQPVFIVGMPRSGTTLVEQILSSHSSIRSAGELQYIDKIANALFFNGHKNHYRYHTPAPEILARHADDYLKQLAKQCENAPRIIDKTPLNFIYLGLITLLFPNAKIIHVTRDPLDTCLSCYFELMVEQPWSFDLHSIADMYLFYRAVMTYWEALIPTERMITVRYETLVANPEAESRRLLTHCHLEWEDTCLTFYKQKRTVKTASVWQSRQPIYADSQQRWKSYQAYLSPLQKALQPYLDVRGKLSPWRRLTRHFLLR